MHPLETSEGIREVKPLMVLSLVFMPVAVGLQTLALVRDGVASWTK